MAPTTTTSSRPRAGARRSGLTAIGLITVTALVAIPTAAHAHHGWDGFETNNLVYISGIVSSEGEWGDPHSHFAITVDAELPADTPDLPIPEELSGPEDSIRVEAALAYRGPHDELEVIIAPPWWSSGNGLDRSLKVGERFQGVGYINRTDDGLFRPVAFWYGDDSAPVNQVIGSTLPVRAPLPGDTATEPTAVPSTIEDPTEMDGPSEDAAEPTAAEDSSPAAWGVWAAFGAVAVVLVIGGILYVRRSSHRTENPDEQAPDA